MAIDMETITQRNPALRGPAVVIAAAASYASISLSTGPLARGAVYPVLGVLLLVSGLIAYGTALRVLDAAPDLSTAALRGIAYSTLLVVGLIFWGLLRAGEIHSITPLVALLIPAAIAVRCLGKAQGETDGSPAR